MISSVDGFTSPSRYISCVEHVADAGHGGVAEHGDRAGADTTGAGNDSEEHNGGGGVSCVEHVAGPGNGGVAGHGSYGGGGGGGGGISDGGMADCTKMEEEVSTVKAIVFMLVTSGTKGIPNLSTNLSTLSLPASKHLPHTR